MKGSCTLFASAVAASTVVLSSNYSSNEVGGSKVTCQTASNKEKFAPKFDGLRFIETLVTAHR